jgi:hypothetical protein
MTYLGDGVYARFDGYQIWLAANHHENEMIALEPAVFQALVNYAETCFSGAVYASAPTTYRGCIIHLGIGPGDPMFASISGKRLEAEDWPALRAKIDEELS